MYASRIGDDCFRVKPWKALISIRFKDQLLDYALNAKCSSINQVI